MAEQKDGARDLKDGIRDLQEQIKAMGIITIEDYNGGIGSVESTLAALDAIRKYEEQRLKKEKSE